MAHDRLTRPRPAVAAVVLTPPLTEVLLIQRSKPPAVGKWTLPGGTLELGEMLRPACAREVKEETGISIDPVGIVKVVERIERTAAGGIAFHYVIVDFWAVVAERSKPVAATDATQATWHPIDELDRLDSTRGLLDVVHRGVCLARNEAPTSPVLEEATDP